MNTSYKSSYQKHKVLEDEMLDKFPSIISDPDSIDCFRHYRMFTPLVTEIISRFPDSSWLTVGDGRFGSDSIYLRKLGAKKIHTSSLTDKSLQIAKSNEWIDEFSCQNAEDLSFEDDSFDFVLCKESYHHFPRPPIAFYELLRVSRLGVVYIEPFRSRYSPLRGVKKIFKLITKRIDHGEYEPAGNYIFRLDIGEFVEYGRALDLPCIWYRLFNDAYHPKLFGNGTPDFKQRLGFKFLVGIQNFLCKLKLLGYGSVSCAVFKVDLNRNKLGNLGSKGIKEIKLGRNPFV